MTDNPPPPGGYPPPPPEGYPPPPPPGGGYPPPPPPGGGYPPPPPPGGGYPPPPQGQPGGFPPSGGFPPPGGYSAPQGGYPPPPQGYPPMGGPSGYSVGEAFGWAWNKFTNNAVPLVVATLAFGVVLLILQGLINLFQILLAPDSATNYVTDDSGFSFSYNVTGVTGILISLVGWFLSLLVGAAIQSAFLGGVIDIANGQQVAIGSFFRPRNIGNVVIATLIVGVITTVGFFLCVIPGVIASIMLMFTVIGVLDRNLAPLDAVKASFDTSKSNFGSVLLAWLVMLLVVVVGAILCGVGLLVAVPVASLILVYTYRVLNGASVAPATQ